MRDASAVDRGNPDRRRFRSRSIRRYPAGSDSEIVYVENTGDCHLFPVWAARAIDACRCFRDLRTHAREVCVRLQYGPAREADVAALLDTCVRRGLLVSDQSLLSGHAVRQPEHSREISTLAVVTSSRPEYLARCVAAAAANTRHHGHRVVFCVADDTPGLNGRLQNWHRLQWLQSQLGIDVRYVGIPQRARFRDELIAEGLDPETVAFALFDLWNTRVSTGANRNALLLATTGELVLSIDDDTECSFIEGHHVETVAVTSAFNPMAMWFHSDEISVRKSAPLMNSDIIAMHARALGSAVPGLLSQVHTLMDVEETDLSHGLMSVLESESGRITVTQNGVAGDSGRSSTAAILTARGSTRARMFASDAAYQTASSTRQIIALVDGYTLTDSPFLMGYAVGLDSQDGLVPFCPVMRNQDGVFGRVVRTCIPGSLTCHLPYAILHDPPSRPAFPPGSAWHDAGHVALADLLVMCLTTYRFDVPVLEPSARLRKLGAHFVDLGSLRERDFWDQLRHTALSAIGSHLAGMEDLRRRQAGPASWQMDLERHVDRLRQSLLGEQFLVPKDLASALSVSRARRLTPRFMRLWGRLLEAWPDIIAATRRLREKERVPAVRCPPPPTYQMRSERRPATRSRLETLWTGHDGGRCTSGFRIGSTTACGRWLRTKTKRSRRRCGAC